MITREEKVAELRREIATRRRVYPSWINRGRIDRETADHRVAVLEAILLDYTGTQVSLFDTEGGHEPE